MLPATRRTKSVDYLVATRRQSERIYAKAACSTRFGRRARDTVPAVAPPTRDHQSLHVRVPRADLYECCESAVISREGFCMAVTGYAATPLWNIRMEVRG